MAQLILALNNWAQIGRSKVPNMPVIALFLASGKKFHSKLSVSAQLFTRVPGTEQWAARAIGWNDVREEEMLLSVVSFHRNTVKFLS